MPDDETGRDRDRVVQWRGTDIWNRIDQAVRDEVELTRVGAKFIPRSCAPRGARAVSRDEIVQDGNGLLSVEEGEETPLGELSVQFALTQSQVEDTERLDTAVTLATRAANKLAGAEDALIFVGLRATYGKTYTGDGRPITGVTFRSSNDPQGLIPLQLDPPNGAPPRSAISWDHTPSFVTYPAIDASRPDEYGDQTFRAVSEALSQLQAFSQPEGRSQRGPFALALPARVYSDVHAANHASHDHGPAERIKPLVNAGLFGTGALPEFDNRTALEQHLHPFGTNWPDRRVRSVGLLISIGGNTVDLARGVDATTAFMQVDDEGRYRFRVYERLALRVKDRRAIVLLAFT